MKRLQTGDIDYKEATAAADMKARIEVDGIKAEKNASVLKVCNDLANLHAQYGPFHSILSHSTQLFMRLSGLRRASSIGHCGIGRGNQF